MEGPVSAGPLVVLASAAVPVLVILFVIWVLRRDVARKQKAVRSPDYWKERPDGRRYPTGGWDQSPGAGSARREPEEGPADDDLSPPEGGDPPVR
ncbi:hypothetical protein ACOQFV_25805 [Nocardiopsis changdeensis]|uniref:DUF2510 domain-containing protein n=1 Tax=Nocardiopsis changdeensis TaxID=2831969 RepID=A0ABX8BFR0_9ACTN|nr:MULTISPECIES: hypothetical protein [Nocardiopsis]QUX21079.1 hypothetical protein KGD84_21850 [Nocardiopsis changdeensis]QYX37009.1 hypothetical protein K1J57_31305 [Nocardiopsis sp. MT53]